MSIAWMSLARLCRGFAAVLVVPVAPWLDQGPRGTGGPKLPCAGSVGSNPDVGAADVLLDWDDADMAQVSDH
jgi:hypothetical protein